MHAAQHAPSGHGCRPPQQQTADHAAQHHHHVHQRRAEHRVDDRLGQPILVVHAQRADRAVPAPHALRRQRRRALDGARRHPPRAKDRLSEWDAVFDPRWIFGSSQPTERPGKNQRKSQNRCSPNGCKRPKTARIQVPGLLASGGDVGRLPERRIRKNTRWWHGRGWNASDNSW